RGRPRSGGEQTGFFIVAGDARNDGWTVFQRCGADHQIGLRKTMPGLAALSDWQLPLEHIALAGAPSRLSDALDIEPNLRQYHRADIEHLGGLGQRPRFGPWPAS